MENQPVYQLNLLKLFVMKKYQTQKYRPIGQAHMMNNTHLDDCGQGIHPNTFPKPSVHLL